MKKVAILLVIAFVTVLVVSSCSSKDCPAYSRVSSEQVDQNI